MPQKLQHTQQQLSTAIREGRLGVRKSVAKALVQITKAAKAGYVDLLAFEILTEQLSSALAKTTTATHMLGCKHVLDSVPKSKALRLDELPEILQRQLDMDPVALEALYQTTALRVARGATQEAERRVRAVVNQSILDGDRPSVAGERIREAFIADGLEGSEPYKLEALFNTQSAIAYQAGQWSSFNSPVVDEILWGFKYVTVGDNRVRPEHVLLDKTTLPKDDPFWDQFWPPNGWNCRCVVIPIYSERPAIQPRGEVEPDLGFNFNAGRVYASAPPVNRVRDFVVQSNTEPSPQRREPHRQLTQRQQAVVAQVPQNFGPIEVSGADATVLDSAVARSRVAKRTNVVVPTNDSAIKRLTNKAKDIAKDDKIQMRVLQVARIAYLTSRGESSSGVEDPITAAPQPGKLILKFRLKAGDIALPIGDARVIIPRGVTLRVVSRRKRANGNIEIVLTPA